MNSKKVKIQMNSTSQKKICILCFIVALFWGCYGNGICFDEKNKMIVSTEGVRITSIDYSRQSIGSSASVMFKSKNINQAKKNIPLSNTIEGYEIVVSYGEKNILKEDGEFFPNSLYEIEHWSRGDAGAGIIKFETDSLGEIIMIKDRCKGVE